MTIAEIITELENNNRETTQIFFKKLRELVKTGYLCYNIPNIMDPKDFMTIFVKVLKIENFIKPNVLVGEFLVINYCPQILFTKQININTEKDFNISKEVFDATLKDVISLIEVF